MAGPRLDRLHNMADFRARARRVLPRPVFDFADGGAEDETTLAANTGGFARWSFLPRPLEGSASRDLSLTLFGRPLTLPVLIGPTGLSGLFWPDGERAAARAAAAAGTAYCLSHASVCRLEELPDLGAPRWMQVFVWRDRDFTKGFVERAAAARFDALVLTIDNQLLGRRERDLRNGFTIPPRLGPAEIVGMAGKLPWLWRMRRALPGVTFANYVHPGAASDVKSLAGQMAGLLDPGLSWQDVDRMRQLWKGPFLLKGILHPDDATRAVAAGVDGIIVSNHGGRQLDGAIAAIDALPGVAAAVAGRVPVLIDGGVRRGADVVKALALGATACLIARPQLWGLAVAGEAGVARVLDQFRGEIDRVLGLMGLTSLAGLSPGHLHRTS